MQDAFGFADEFGPTRTIHVHDSSIGLRAILVIDNVAAGPAIGGLRIAPDVSAEECFRLARAMTFKNAAAGLAHGGGKVVLYGDSKMPREDKEHLIRALACALGDIRDYIFGPDMGTDETCMAWVKDEIGRSVGLPRELGGIPLDQIGATGWGVAHATEVAAPYCNFELAGARVVIQGYGAVGRHAAHFLALKGAIVVGVADSAGTLADAAGIDLGLLDRLKAEGKSVLDYPRGEKFGREAAVDVECEIWIRAARPDVVHEGNVARLATRLVVQGANIPFTRGAEACLHQKGVLCIPDFIANAGGVICAAVEYAGGSQAAALDRIAATVRENTAEVIEAATRRGQSPRDAALDLATARVRKAMSFRRWGAL
ncbi:Glu/Leu/Phe/Val family dehydrogenase [Burkholderia stagnalis]|uniref:Glu/Leu/Phe/Val family dehydrogenase n=1 Tax=Burkholderia stagnalis TaxID=1503054 RepID=UPI000F56318C|nr:Glu/Leu/Phe/Val dehydrogenase dimerization domain-containing protein [Burkholderia stagnalis]RQQ42966.1 Glu/Leu/Phe/Val dehydrogenase [Burkholderia stagnalis]RQX89424.1 Glu/Leu/Phe/Val dehydrogenase [Burkholderia stagnalis]RQY08774.1 Glu/Leu/Phe/Val dehydrogenase [Burkholderia stagnalis]RQY24759.1 Glu/Leu/Phe/Val dehydrogenase [Burkholderia stagnalis]